jgi:hypothetical protein
MGAVRPILSILQLTPFLESQNNNVKSKSTNNFKIQNQDLAVRHDRTINILFIFKRFVASPLTIQKQIIYTYSVLVKNIKFCNLYFSQYVIVSGSTAICDPVCAR